VAVTVVQSASSGATATSLTVTLGSPVTAGNTLCASVSVWDEDTSTWTIALETGSSPDNWVLHRKAARNASRTNSYAAAWADTDCAGGASTVTITLTGATGGFLTGIICQVWEVAGLATAAEDITGATGGNSGAFTTGAFTPSSGTSAADEFWWASVTVASGGLTVTGPAGWTNTAQLSSGTASTAMMAGCQTPGATGSPAYSGTISGAGSQWACAGATLKAGTAAGTAALAGSGTLGASGGPGASAALSGEGGLDAAGASEAPDSAALAGSGTLAAAGSVTVGGTAALSGTGAADASGTPPVMVSVVNQWQGTVAQNPVFGPSLPALAGVTLPLTPASSVGGGSGTATAGNWLFAICGWRQAPGSPPATINAADDTHGWWRPSAPSLATGITRTTIWYTPNIGQVTTVPACVYVAPDGYVAGLAVLVIEVAGLGPWDLVPGMAVNYAASASTLTLAVTL